MCSVRVTISASDRKDVARHVKTAPHLGHVRQVTYLLAILAVIDGQSVAQVALVWRVHAQTVATWGQRLCCSGLQGAPRHTPTGRPPTLPPTPPRRPGHLDGGGARQGWLPRCLRAVAEGPAEDG